MLEINHLKLNMLTVVHNPGRTPQVHLKRVPPQTCPEIGMSQSPPPSLAISCHLFVGGAILHDQPDPE